MNIYAIICICLVLFKLLKSEYVCPIVENEKLSDSIYSQNIVKRSSNRLNLKITPVYDRKVVTSKAFSKIKRAVEGAVKFWEKALIVEVKKPENVVIQRTCELGSMVTSSTENKPHCRRDTCKKSETCFDMEIPNKYLSACHARKYRETKEMFTEGEGIAPNEFVLLVSRNNVSCGGNVLAWASYCSQDPHTSRPNLGIVNYCLTEDAILGANEKKLEDVTKHEICHALGFLPTVYSNLPDLSPQYRMPDGNLRPVQNITMRWLSARGEFRVTRRILRLPNMLREARRHFGCNQLEGIELQNSHFSHRIAGDDLMTPSTSATQSVSRIILAYFKDTNFYDVDYTMATEFHWGKGLGCDFVMKSCYEFIKNRKRRGQDIQPFCDKPNEIKCLRSQNAKAFCTLYKREGEIKPEFQYMDNSFNVSVNERKYYRGLDRYDYCPVFDIMITSNGNIAVCEKNKY
ncbi:hypothetical protein MS3_00010877 [Schistosoma haematobium]|uniref:Leishmanolysin-like peptidase n=1 Tax=Schistosoma haematobium TaxID=6185 RepID=A0A922ILS4_SCHHA|nr:hypothetical protein MS3_00010877 [Schistosoma haematobium]KAH9582472.1 hypothetical protein MS3_00010877 [Schistosoma haematobium]CAH8596993.1 unnamed protein product [Schistosoma haematobium]